MWDIRERYSEGESGADRYEDFKDLETNIQTFRRIILGYTYKTVGNIPTKEQKRYTNAKLTAEQVKDIRKSYIRGKVSFREIAEKYNMSEHCISLIVKRKTYKNVD